jgi:Arc/MetJ-type ribon-helix-helix transcriptional regulator
MVVMSNVINISLPVRLSKEVNKAIKTGYYTSEREFFSVFLRWWEEEKLLKELQESQREIAMGKGKVLHSLKDLR